MYRNPNLLPFGMPLQPTSSLPLVAWKEGFFAAEGLNVNLQNYPSGKLAVKGMLAGECDLADSMSIPVVIVGFEALGAPVESIRRLWPGIQLELFLSQSLLVNLEDEAAWAAPLTQGEPPVNFLDFIWPHALLSTKPGGISIITAERP